MDMTNNLATTILIIQTVNSNHKRMPPHLPTQYLVPSTGLVPSTYEYDDM